MIAGGLADGSIALWDAQQVLRGRSESAQLAKETEHHGAVSTLPVMHGWVIIPISLLAHSASHWVHCHTVTQGRLTVNG